jgi:hypothetical protein
MTTRRIAIGVLGAGALLAACTKEPAGPFINFTSAKAGTIIVKVLTDKSNSATATNFSPQSAVRVNVYRFTDTLPLRSLTTDAGGRAVFAGLPTGQYKARLAARPLSVANGPDSVVFFAAPGVIDSTPLLRVRLGAKIGGFVAAEFTDQNKLTSQRFAGVVVEFLRDTSSTATASYAVFASDTSDANGNVEVIAKPGPAKFRMRFQLPTPASTDSLRAAIDTLKTSADSITITSAAGINPDANVVQNMLFNYTSSFTGSVFRDAGVGAVSSTFTDSTRNNGSLDSLQTAAGPPPVFRKEGLVAGDTIIIQLRDSASTKILSTARATSATPTYKFSSLKGGTYTIQVDVLSSKLASNPQALVRTNPVKITLATSVAKLTNQHYAVPYGP